MEQALAIVGIYAALNSFIFFWLSNETGKIRRTEKIALGDGENKHLAKIMRGSANAAENIPMFTICLVIAAAIDTPLWALHLAGVLFFAGRAVHAWYFVQAKASMMPRFIGFGIAFVTNAVLCLWLIVAGMMAMIG
ncbi:MAG: MAPEG family protein [Pseudomonadota bacterium]